MEKKKKYTRPTITTILVELEQNLVVNTYCKPQSISLAPETMDVEDTIKQNNSL